MGNFFPGFCLAYFSIVMCWIFLNSLCFLSETFFPLLLLWLYICCIYQSKRGSNPVALYPFLLRYLSSPPKAQPTTSTSSGLIGYSGRSLLSNKALTTFLLAERILEYEVVGATKGMPQRPRFRLTILELLSRKSVCICAAMHTSAYFRGTGPMYSGIAAIAILASGLDSALGSACSNLVVISPGSSPGNLRFRLYNSNPTVLCNKTGFPSGPGISASSPA